MAGHGPGVAEREVDVGVAVDVGDPAAAGLGEEHREAAGPLGHPGHGHAADQVLGGLGGRRLGRGPGLGERRALGGEPVGELRAVDVGHGGSSGGCGDRTGPYRRRAVRGSGGGCRGNRVPAPAHVRARRRVGSRCSGSGRSGDQAVVHRRGEAGRAGERLGLVHAEGPGGPGLDPAGLGQLLDEEDLVADPALVEADEQQAERGGQRAGTRSGAGRPSPLEVEVDPDERRRPSRRSSSQRWASSVAERRAWATIRRRSRPSARSPANHCSSCSSSQAWRAGWEVAPPWKSVSGSAGRWGSAVMGSSAAGALGIPNTDARSSCQGISAALAVSARPGGSIDLSGPACQLANHDSVNGTVTMVTMTTDLPAPLPQPARAACPSADELDAFRAVQRLAYQGAEEVAAHSASRRHRAPGGASSLRTWLEDHGVDDWFHLRSPGSATGPRSATSGRRCSSSPPAAASSRAWATSSTPPRSWPGPPPTSASPARSGPNPAIGPDHGRPGRPPGADPRRGPRRRTFQEVYEAVDRLAAEQGYANRHHAVPRPRHRPPRRAARRRGPAAGSPRPGSAGATSGSLVRTIAVGRRERWSPLWSGDRRSDHAAVPGLWAMEPHLGLRGAGAKFEELLRDHRGRRVLARRRPAPRPALGRAGRHRRVDRMSAVAPSCWTSGRQVTGPVAVARRCRSGAPPARPPSSWSTATPTITPSGTSSPSASGRRPPRGHLRRPRRRRLGRPGRDVTATGWSGSSRTSRAVVDAVSPERPVHLVGHDWGSIQAWAAVTDPSLGDRFASFTSMSGPSLDHVGRVGPSAPRPRPSAAGPRLGARASAPGTSSPSRAGSRRGSCARCSGAPASGHPRSEGVATDDTLAGSPPGAQRRQRRGPLPGEPAALVQARRRCPRRRSRSSCSFPSRTRTSRRRCSTASRRWRPTWCAATWAASTG